MHIGNTLQPKIKLSQKQLNNVSEFSLFRGFPLKFHSFRGLSLEATVYSAEMILVRCSAYSASEMRSSSLSAFRRRPLMLLMDSRVLAGTLPFRNRLRDSSCSSVLPVWRSAGVALKRLPVLARSAVPPCVIQTGSE